MTKREIKPTRIYIAGKVTGDSGARSKFMNYEKIYSKKGYDVKNPMSLCCQSWSWMRCMAKCLLTMSKCQVVAFIPDWRDSHGARIEMIAALMMGKTIELIPKK